MMPSFKMIVVPMDFSTGSTRALAYARVLAERFGASLHLLHVVQDPYLAAGWSEGYPAIPDLTEQLRQETERRLQDLASSLTPLTTSTEAVVGTPAQTIAQVATEQRADLIVMGTHGRTGVAHLLLGSVAERVIRSAPCPVLTVRDSSVAVPVLAKTGEQPAPQSE